MKTTLRRLIGVSSGVAIALAYTCARVPAAKSADNIATWTPDKVDITRLRPLPTSSQLAPQHSSFATADIAKHLLHTDQPFITRTAALPGATLAESPSFSLLRRGGVFVAMEKAPAAAATKVDPPALIEDARQRLLELGIPKPELGAVFQSQLRWQDRNADGQLSSIQGGIWKTFVLRSFQGIEVIGHRAVFTHGSDGKLRKALVAWPPLAANGHQLKTRDSADQIRRKAVLALEASGQPASRALLTWRLRPIEDAAGAVRLKLEVAAAVVAESPQAVDDPRAVSEEVVVPIDLTP